MNTAIEVSAVPAVNAQQIAVEALLVETVVSHDTSASPVIAAQGVKATYAYLDQLVMERELWEQNAYRTSNDQLYALLAKCYQMYKAMGFDTDEAKALRDGLKTYIDLKGYKFVKSTHTLNKIVQCVFGVDRRRVSAYSIALREALRQEVGADDLIVFLQDNGGVEQIRMGGTKPLSATKRAELVKAEVSEAVISKVKFDPETVKANADWVDKQVVFVATYLPTGEFEVNAVVRHDGAVNTALAAYYTLVQAKKREEANALKKAEADAVAAQKSEAKAAAKSEDKTAKQIAKTAKEVAETTEQAKAIEAFDNIFVTEAQATEQLQAEFA